MKRFLRRLWRSVRPCNPLTVARWYLALARANWRWRRDLARLRWSETRRAMLAARMMRRLAGGKR